MMMLSSSVTSIDSNFTISTRLNTCLANCYFSGNSNKTVVFVTEGKTWETPQQTRWKSRESLWISQGNLKQGNLGKTKGENGKS
jgi:hypothetical protein